MSSPEPPRFESRHFWQGPITGRLRGLPQREGCSAHAGGICHQPLSLADDADGARMVGHCKGFAKPLIGVFLAIGGWSPGKTCVRSS